MNTQKTILAASTLGLALMAGATSTWGQPDEPTCTISGRGSLATGDEFFGQVNVLVAGAVAPGGIWRHFEVNASGTPEQVFLGRVEAGTCLINGNFLGGFGGIGRLRGRPVEFAVFVRDVDPGGPDFYRITITDFDGFEVFRAEDDLVDGDISVVIF